MANPRVFKVEMENKATYFVKDEDGTMTEEEATALAWEWFDQRTPEIYCEELEASSIPAVDAYC